MMDLSLPLFPFSAPKNGGRINGGSAALDGRLSEVPADCRSLTPPPQKRLAVTP